jgi:PPK2 family polyphosphate:nucleotide phosphotransferase
MHGIVFDKPDEKVRLDDIDTRPPDDITKEDAARYFGKLDAELFQLQDWMWGARTNAVLVVLQGRDTAGKDGTVKHVVGGLNPRGVSVVSFGVPTKEEVEHDFLWRVHRHAPRKGEFAIFNRSHYEDVLVVRVNELAPKSMWKPRFAHILDFEQLLSDESTIILKFFLHISKKEQKQRLLAREESPDASWKLSVSDWRDRERWGDYTEAYEDVIRRTATAHAPWIVVPADAKWYRNLVVAEAVVETLRPYAKAWRARTEEIGVEGRRAIAAYRTQRGES